MLKDIGGNRKRYYRIVGILIVVFLVTVFGFHLLSMHDWNHLDELGHLSAEELQQTKDNSDLPISNPIIFESSMIGSRQEPMGFQRDKLINALVTNGFICSDSDPAWNVTVNCARQVYRDEVVFTIYGGAGIEGNVYSVTLNYKSNTNLSESSMEAAKTIFVGYSDIFLVHLDQELSDTLINALLAREKSLGINRYKFLMEYSENSVKIVVWYQKHPW